MGDTKGGPFDIPFDAARIMLDTPNVNGCPSSDIVTPWCNGLDVTRRTRDVWIIDYGVQLSEDAASKYDAAFTRVQQAVYPERKDNKRESYRLRWWLHMEARSGMRAKLAPADPVHRNPQRD